MTIPPSIIFETSVTVVIMLPLMIVLLVVHFGAAILLFLLLAIVAGACANKSLEFLPPDKDPVRYRRIYIGIAIGMFVLPALAWFVTPVLGFEAHRVFFVEAAGVLTFGFYWLVKSLELEVSGLETDPDEAVRCARSRPPSL